jgi:hypothetical protein
MEQIDVSGASAAGTGKMWRVSSARERQKRSDRVHKGGDPAGAATGRSLEGLPFLTGTGQSLDPVLIPHFGFLRRFSPQNPWGEMYRGPSLFADRVSQEPATSHVGESENNDGRDIVVGRR